MKIKISLKWFFPLSILTIGLASTLVAGIQNYINTTNKTIETLRQRAVSTCHLMTLEFERAIQEGNTAVVHQLVQSAMLIPDLLNASLIDPENNLVSSSEVEQKSYQASLLLESQISKAIAEARKTQTVTSVYDASRQLVLGIAPIRFADFEQANVAKSTGVLIVQLDYGIGIHTARRDLFRHFLTLALIIAIATIIISYLFSQTLSKDLSLVMKLVSAYSAGSPLPIDTPAWSSELSQVSTSLSTMFKELSAREQELKRSESRFRELFDSSADGAMLIDREGRVLGANKTMCEIIGVSEQELIAHGIIDLTLTSIEHLTEYAAAVERHGSVSIEVEFVRRNGTRFWAEVRAQRLVSANIGQYLAAIRDITQRVELAAKEREELIDQKLLTLITSMGIESHNLKQYEARLLAMLGTRLKVSRAYIFEYIHESDTMNNAAEWVAADVSPRIDKLQGIPCSSLPWWMEQVSRGEKIDYYEIDSIPDEATRELLRPQGIKSILVIPLHIGNRYRGFMGLDHCQEHHHWSERERNLLASAVRVLMGVWADDDLRQSDERLRSMLVNMSTIAVSSFNGDGKLLYWNHAAELLYGHSANEAIGQCVVELLATDADAAAQKEFVKQLAASNLIPVPKEQKLRRVDGALLTVNSYWSVVNLPGQPTEIFRFDTDLTGIRVAEEKERQLALAVEQSPIGVLITDVKGNITYVNRAFETTTGYQLEEVLGKNPRFLQSGRTNPDEYKALWSSLRLGRDWRGQLLNRRKDGSLYWELNHISPVIGSNGKAHNFLAIKEDISERIRAEEEREKLQAQLMQAQKMETVGRFAGGIAHDFNNMLNVILGYTEISLEHLEQDSPVRPLLTEVRSAATRSASLTRQLLAFSRKQTLQTEVFEINGVFSNMEKMIRRLIGEDIEINMLLSEEAGSINADRGQIEQVIMNLVVNARDAMPNGGRLTLETLPFDVDDNFVGLHFSMRPGRYVRLSVSDTGVGMDTDTLQHIFDPFFTTKEVGKGTGLGLATVYAILNSLEGQVHVYSEPTLGTTFHVYLPSTSSSASSETVVDVTPQKCGGETILVVEDEVSLQQLLVHILSNAGYKVVATNDPLSAIQLFEKESSDVSLLLTDVIMPVMNGAELSKRLCEIKPALKVLFMSGYTDAIISQHGVHTARQKFIDKPFTAAGILNKIGQVLADIA